MDGADESRDAVEELICALVSIGIAGLLDGLGAGEVAASMRSALNIGAARVSDAFKRDLERILERNAREVRDDASSSSSQAAADAAADESVWSDEEHERKTAAHDGAVRAQTFVSRACGDAAVQTVTSYQRVLNGMAHDINTIGYERAAKAAMRRFEDAGITCAVYDRNGRKVRLSLQAVVNRELSSIGNRALFDQTISLAKRTGDNLVEVNTTANCRESHASWQGGIYQLEGSGEHRNFYTACRWGDPVNGIGGYNCGHRFRIYRPSDGRRFGDPLDGTGYTTEDARRLKGSQRRYERIIRNAKLEIEAIDRSGIDDATKAELKRAARARMADARTRMNMLIAEHPKLLKREQWRERTYTQNAGGYGGLSNAKPQGPAPVIKRQVERDDSEQIRDGVHRNGVTFVEYKGHKADYGTHSLPNGGTFVGPSRERAVELLKDRFGADSIDPVVGDDSLQIASEKGALNNRNDPDHTRRRGFADSYYREIVNRDRKTVIGKIARAANINYSQAERAFNHVFIEKHELYDGYRTFDPDYDMAQSFQRIIDTGDVQFHDIVLVRHECLESEYMEDGLSYGEAHDKAEELYNYVIALNEWLRENGYDA